ncbi:MAG: type I glutamate--ammonia ligase [bacterium]|nr:type I glutamate--ammonia ligase [bacterium]
MTSDNYDSRDLTALVREHEVSSIRLQFTDILGIIKNVAIPASQLPKALDGQIMFDGSSIEGFVRIEESDMFLRPDPASFALLPWRSPEGGASARLICDVYTPEGEPFEGCPRCALKRVTARAARMGFEMMAGMEAEFFLFLRDEQGRATTRTHDQGSYYDLAPVDRGEQARQQMVEALTRMGFEIETSHHESAPGQHEIDFRYAEAVTTADNIATFRYVVRVMARDHGLHATFMPKPVYGVNGSGMHTHQSLFRNGQNAFADPSGRWGLSATALNYLAGLIGHAREFTAITNPLVNSYKRLIPGYEAPVYIAWSERNRSPFIRVPSKRGGSSRLEIRSPDPSCNPYLALAVMLQAGLDGVERRMPAPEPVNRNLYRLSERERVELGVESLPGSLREALQEMSQSELVHNALGDHIFQRFLEAKQIEYSIYRSQVHQWEVEQYLSVF